MPFCKLHSLSLQISFRFLGMNADRLCAKLRSTNRHCGLERRFLLQPYLQNLDSEQSVDDVGFGRFLPFALSIVDADMLQLFGAIGFMLLTYWKRKSYPTNL